MRVICAPDKFKGSLTAQQAAEAMERGVRRVCPEASVDLCPIADGGEGTVEALVAATAGEVRTSEVAGPLPDQRVRARWGMLGGASEGTAAIEMAEASGLALVPTDRRDPTKTTTVGTGELVREALAVGVKHIVLGIGGSATTDGGCGAAAAMGFRFLDARGKAILPAPAGGDLLRIARIERPPPPPEAQPLRGVTITVACDVTNPITGPRGAAAVYGPQKGATPAQIDLLDRGLRQLAMLWREQLGVDVEQMPGAGAAGGSGGGLVAFFGATLLPGVDMVLDAVGFERRVTGCDLCLTGEGKLDGQSLSGKACAGVAQAARRHGVETVALVGCVGPGAERAADAGLSDIRVIGEGLPPEESIRRAAELLELATARLVEERIARETR
jgi:glycerate kinase